MATAALSRTVPQATGTTAAPPRHQRGYSPEIFESKEDRDRFSCGFCSRILRDPVQAECGHRFCQNCQRAIEEWVNVLCVCVWEREEGGSDCAWVNCMYVCVCVCCVTAHACLSVCFVCVCVCVCVCITDQIGTLNIFALLVLHVLFMGYALTENINYETNWKH